MFGLCLILSFYLVYDKYFRASTIQLSNPTNSVFQIPEIKASDGWIDFSKNRYKGYIEVLNTSFSKYSIDTNNNIIINEGPGLYTVNFSISGFKSLISIEDSDTYDTNFPNTNPYCCNTAVDYTVEWRIVNCTNNTVLCVIPAFSNNRTLGPENVNHFSKIICIEDTPAILKLQFRCNEEPEITVTNYVINNFVFSLTRI